jgi:tol-pal system beta propeller repeat protein TolB
MTLLFRGKGPPGPLKRWLLTGVAVLAAGACAYELEDVPEVQLEARTLSYWRPGLALVLPVEGQPLRERFARRLRRGLDWAGTLRLVEGPPADSLAEPGAWSVLEPDPRAGEAGWALRLRQAGEGAGFAAWRLPVDEEGRSEALADALAEELLRLLTGFATPFRSRLLYAEPGAQGHRLVLSDWFGEQVQRLGRGDSPQFSPSWAPDGRRFAYVALREETGADLFIGSLDGGASRLLLGGPESDAAPAWSPDGAWIACAATYAGNTDIWLLPDPEGPAAGQARRRLTFSPGIDTAPSWSPDGRHLVFTSDRSGLLQLYRIGVDGLGEQRLSFLGAACDCPSWSPDGEWIAFSLRERQGFQLYQMRPDGSDLVRLSDEPGNHFDPCWSPDGQQLAVNWQGGVWLLNADGGGRRLLSPRGGETPAWSPAAPPLSMEEAP